MNVLLRLEEEKDYNAVENLTREAFGKAYAANGKNCIVIICWERSKTGEEIKKPGSIIDIRYSREEVPGTAPQKYEK